VLITIAYVLLGIIGVGVGLHALIEHYEKRYDGIDDDIATTDVLDDGDVVLFDDPEGDTTYSWLLDYYNNIACITKNNSDGVAVDGIDLGTADDWADALALAEAAGWEIKGESLHDDGWSWVEVAPRNITAAFVKDTSPEDALVLARGVGIAAIEVVSTSVEGDMTHVTFTVERPYVPKQTPTLS